MSGPMHRFDNFAVGDLVTFERTFAAADFAAFAALSGDSNPLHHDEAHAATTRFGSTIVPLHLVLAPLSMIAGMALPGEASLYLGHEVRAVRPVHYGKTLRYSARIEAINSAHRVLSIRVLALHGADVMMDATMRVQATRDAWSTGPALPVTRSSAPARAIVTGAAGEIGSAVACALAKRGWQLLLQDRGSAESRERLIARLNRIGAKAEHHAADLATSEGQRSLATAAAKLPDIGLVVHAASPRIDADLAALVEVNYSALSRLASAVVPAMLSRQRGAILLIGSAATERAIPHWENYSAAKAMATNLVSGLDRRLGPYGVRGLAVLPGLVATGFSEAFRAGAPALLAEEVAEAALDFALGAADGAGNGNALFLEPDTRRYGMVGFHVAAVSPAQDAPAPSTAPPPPAAPVPGEPGVRIADLIRRVLRMPQSADLSSAALGTTPGWDSLAQIELLLQVERTFGIRFTSQEMEAAQRFADLDRLCRQKLAAAASESQAAAR